MGVFRSQKKLKEGFVAVILSDGEYEVHLEAAEYANILNSFMNGKAFIEAKDLYGASQTIKTSRVCGVAFVTPESIAVKIQLEKEEDEFDKEESLK